MTAEQYAKRFHALLHKKPIPQAAAVSPEAIDQHWTASCLTSSLDLVDGTEVNEGRSLEEYELWRQASDAAEPAVNPDVLDCLSSAPAFAPTICERPQQPTAAANSQAFEDDPCSPPCAEDSFQSPEQSQLLLW